MLTGGCYCKAIRYRVSGRIFDATICHCEMCRGTTGAPCVAWFSVASNEFALLAGAPASFRSSDHATRTFCPTCGTQLTFRDDARPDETDVTICSLDDPNMIAPQDHTFTRSQAGWLKLADGLPRFTLSRAEG
ncbi:GFA family protein [Massilia sp. R2A-15]|uniref:GFA family protein n=1 Tax=Massilia sp. R2A-15 TaxID=3064278 RepID=UPI002732D1D3|nr:GFA family protein [Massilia sp. R2A-15]WLI89164.1 GFA family protein [Massilia sp. R2A-15]